MTIYMYSPPSFANNYNVQLKPAVVFDEEDVMGYLKTEILHYNWKPNITPYSSFDNGVLIAQIKSKVLPNKMGLFSNLGTKELLTLICTFLSPRDLVHFSRVNSCCYLATKSDDLWKGKLHKLFSKVQCLSKEDCPFSPEGQFQIVCHRIQQDQKPFRLQKIYEQQKLREREQKLLPYRDKRLRSGEIKYIKRAADLETLEQIRKCKAALRKIPKRYNNQAIFNSAINASIL